MLDEKAAGEDRTMNAQREEYGTDGHSLAQFAIRIASGPGFDRAFGLSAKEPLNLE